MRKLVRFSVQPFAGKWVAQMMVAPKVEGMAFGSCGAQAYNLGRFITKEQAIACINNKRASFKAVS